MSEAQRIAAKLTEADPWLVDYLAGWWGYGPAQPWGAAMSFALETAHGYGLIRGECDVSETPLGLEVRKILEAQS